MDAMSCSVLPIMMDERQRRFLAQKVMLPQVVLKGTDSIKKGGLHFLINSCKSREQDYYRFVLRKAK